MRLDRAASPLLAFPPGQTMLWPIDRAEHCRIESRMLLILTVVVLNIGLGFTAAIVLGYGPPGLAEIWVAASGEMAKHQGHAAEVGEPPPAESPRAPQPAPDSSEQPAEQPSLSLPADAEPPAEGSAALPPLGDDRSPLEPTTSAV